MPFEIVLIGLLAVVILVCLIIIAFLTVKKPAPLIDLAGLAEDVSSRIREDISKAIIETIGKVSESIGGVSKTLDTLSKTLEKMDEKLPKDVKESIEESGVKESLKEALDELKGFSDGMTELSENLPGKVLRSIQSSLSFRKGKVGELATLMRLLGAYKRIIPLGQPVDYIGISDENIDFIETKTGTSQLTQEEREIKGLVDAGKVRFILRREEVEITAPEEIEEVAKAHAIYDEGKNAFFCQMGSQKHNTECTYDAGGIVEHLRDEHDIEPEDQVIEGGTPKFEKQAKRSLAKLEKAEETRRKKAKPKKGFSKKEN